MLRSEIKRCDEIGCKYPIVNKKYGQCQKHNYERLHQGQSQAEVYQQRKKNKEQQNSSDSRSRFISKVISDEHNTSGWSSNKIRHVSKINRYKCSDGTTVTKVEINRNYQRTCDEIRNEREPVCQGTGRSDLPLSFSHTISRDRCQRLGKSELIWDKDNIELESYEPPCSNPTCAHNIWESGSLEKKKTLLNFTRKLEYIEKHDPQLYQRLSG